MNIISKYQIVALTPRLSFDYDDQSPWFVFVFWKAENTPHYSNTNCDFWQPVFPDSMK